MGIKKHYDLKLDKSKNSMKTIRPTNPLLLSSNQIEMKGVIIESWKLHHTQISH